MLRVSPTKLDVKNQFIVGAVYALLELFCQQVQISAQNANHFVHQLIVIPHLAFGFAVGVLLCFGWHYIVGIGIGAFVIFGVASYFADIPPSSFFVILPIAFSALGFFILRNRLKWFIGISSISDFFKTVGLIFALFSLISPVLNLAFLAGPTFSSVQTADHFLRNWLSDFNGCLLVIPFIIDFHLPQKTPLKPESVVWSIVLTFGILILGQIVFLDWFVDHIHGLIKPSWLIFFMIILVLLLKAIRYIAVVVLAVVVQIVLSGLQSHGFFSDDLLESGLRNSNIFILIFSSIILLVGYFIRETQLLKLCMQENIDLLHLKAAALDAISQGVITTDAERKITYTNRAFRELTLYSEDELIGNDCKLLQGEETNPATEKQIRLGLNSRQPVSVEIVNYKKNGDKFWNEVSISPVFHEGKLTQFVGTQHDITFRKKYQQESAMAKVVFEQNHNAIVVTDSATKIVSVNPTFTRITGYSEEEAVGNTPRILSTGLHDETFYQTMWRNLNEFGFWEGEIFNKGKDGTTYLQYLTISSVVDAHRNLTNYIGMFHDLTEERSAQNKIESLQYHDQLTNLPNAIALESLVRACIENFALHAHEPELPSAALLALDIDYFKNINDTLDHHIGNNLLIQVAARLSDLLTSNDILSRQGGDEFTFFLPDVSAAQTNEFAKNILQLFLPPFNVEGHSLNLSVSIGIAMYPEDGTNLNALLRSADIALNHVKQNGKRHYLFHSVDLTHAVNEKVALEFALQMAAENDELRLFYQPVIDIASGKINSFEALIRWEHPTLGWISPVRFIPIAEENNSIAAIGHWVLHRACRDIRFGLDAGIEMPPIAINFSPKQFKNVNLTTELLAVLAEYQLSPAQLCIELTEGILMTDPNASRIILESLRELGFTLSLDDFGTGYSSLSYLKSFPFDKVKIDQSFVRGLKDKNQDAAIINAIIYMGHSLGIKVLAEGVETEAQCEFLRDHMIDEIQGFLFSQPLTWDKTFELIKENRQLPPKLLRHPPSTKTLLLVDDEQNIVSALKRLLRRDGYEILTANSGLEGLAILSQHPVDVIISDQRMPGMTGVEFLSQVKEIYPNTIRLVLSGYTELKSVTDAINEGAVFRFLTKPWDDEKLRECVKEAFQYKNFSDENRELSIKAQTSNFELAVANRQLAEMIDKKQNQIAIHTQSLDIVREALRHTSVALLGLDDAHLVAFINEAAITLFSSIHLNFGDELLFSCPELNEIIMQAKESSANDFTFNHQHFVVRWYNMGTASTKGKIVTISPIETTIQ